MSNILERYVLQYMCHCKPSAFQPFPPQDNNRGICWKSERVWKLAINRRCVLFTVDDALGYASLTWRTRTPVSGYATKQRAKFFYDTSITGFWLDEPEQTRRSTAVVYPSELGEWVFYDGFRCRRTTPCKKIPAEPVV